MLKALFQMGQKGIGVFVLLLQKNLHQLIVVQAFLFWVEKIFKFGIESQAEILRIIFKKNLFRLSLHFLQSQSDKMLCDVFAHTRVLIFS